jgi:hypothetical protein
MESKKRRSRAELAEEHEQDRRFLLELWAILDPIFQASALHNAALAPDEATAERLRQMAEVSYLDLMRRGLENVEVPGSRASRTGMRLGLQDSLEFSRDFTPEEVRAADERMTAAGLPTLTAMRHRIWQTIPQAIARGRCRNETEYYLLKERLIDMGDETLSPADRETLERIVGEFEDRPAKKKPRH